MFGIILKTLRRERGLTQSEFANDLNLNPVTVNRYENEKRFPDIATLIAIADYFDVPLDLLVGREWPAVKKCEGSEATHEASAQLETAGSSDLEISLKDEAYIRHLLSIYKMLHKQYGIALPLSDLTDSAREKVIDYYDLICNAQKS